MPLDHTITVDDAVRALAIVGDLSMGQPTDQSMRAASLAARLAAADGASGATCAQAALVALLRWSGCTANAAGFAALLGDDVGGRDAMLTQTLPAGHPLSFTSVAPLARIHCEVSGDLAGMLGLPADVEAALRSVFEHFDGSGLPAGLAGAAVPSTVYYAALAGDLDILARAHGCAEALRLIGQLAGRKYPPALVALLAAHAPAWLDALDLPAATPAASVEAPRVPLTIVADMIELKLPWLLGYSRRVMTLAEGAAALAGLDAPAQALLGRAALIHGIGRAAVSNAVWERPGPLASADWEKVRLVPYWTARAGTLIGALRAEAALASHAYERLDGSGYYRGAGAAALDLPQRLLAASAAYAALCMPRPWRAAHPSAEAGRLLEQDAAAGRFCARAVALVLEAAGARVPASAAARKTVLSERETAVLRRISLGESNKAAARALGISPSTVGTHVESVFRKLACSTRAAATLKALTLGLI